MIPFSSQCVSIMMGVDVELGEVGLLSPHPSTGCPCPAVTVRRQIPRSPGDLPAPWPPVGAAAQQEWTRSFILNIVARSQIEAPLVSIAMFKKDNQQGPTVQHRELCSMLCGSLDGRGVWGRKDTWICMAESLCCAPETITTVLIGYTPKEDKK